MPWNRPLFQKCGERLDGSNYNNQGDIMNIQRKIGLYAGVGGMGAALVLLGTIAFGENAVTAFPDNYKVEFENDQVRVIRINYAPGQKTGMHDHGAGVVINLSDMGVRFTLPDGTTQQDNSASGTATWSDAGTHAAENVSARAIQALYIELK